MSALATLSAVRPPAVEFYVILGICVLIAAFFVFVVVTALWERQFLADDVEPTAEPYPYPPLPYWLVTREHARQCGLLPAGDFATRKTSSIGKGLQSMWTSRERHILVAIVGCSFGSLTLKRTILRSRLADGRILESADDPVMMDVSGTIQKAVLINAGIQELLSFHIQRIANSGSFIVPFTGPSAIKDYEAMDLERGDRLVGMGLAKWTNPDKTTIRMTLRGALSMAQRNYIGKLGDYTSQADRSKIPRAGS